MFATEQGNRVFSRIKVNETQVVYVGTKTEKKHF